MIDKPNLSKIQKEIVEATEPFIVVHSSAGSGKTRCLVERLRFLLSNGVSPEKIVAITFTNAAAEEIYERVGNPKGLFVGTIHSYANRLLTSQGVNTKDILNKDNFNKLFERIKDHPECVKKVEYLLIDEGQDSTPEQFEFCLQTINPEHWMIFADTRQAIYRFAGAYPEHILELMHQKGITTYNLDENYRNAPDILSFARQLLMPLGSDYADYSIPMRQEKGRVITTEYSGDGIARTISRRVKEGTDEYKDWFILTRTNAQSEQILAYLKKYDIPCDTFKKANLDSASLKKKMNEDTVKVLTIHTSKGLEAKNVIVIGTHFKDVEERCLCYVAATRARDLLVWTHSPKKRKTYKGVTNWE